MKRLLAILALILASGQTIVVRRTPVSAASCFGGTFQFCDDFSGTLANFTQELGVWTIGSGITTAPTSPSSTLYMKHNTAAAGTTQYAIVKLNNIPGGDQGVFLRGTSALPGTARRYAIYVASSGTVVWWSTLQDDGVFIEDNGTSCALAFANGNYLAARVTGADTATVVEVWKYTSAPTGPPSGTPDCTFVADPLNPCDDGTGIGLYGSGGEASKSYDNFAGGGS